MVPDLIAGDSGGPQIPSQEPPGEGMTTVETLACVSVVCLYGLSLWHVPLACSFGVSPANVLVLIQPQPLRQWTALVVTGTSSATQCLPVPQLVPGSGQQELGWKGCVSSQAKMLLGTQKGQEGEDEVLHSVQDSPTLSTSGGAGCSGVASWSLSPLALACVPRSSSTKWILRSAYSLPHGPVLGPLALALIS